MVSLDGVNCHVIYCHARQTYRRATSIAREIIKTRSSHNGSSYYNHCRRWS